MQLTRIHLLELRCYLVEANELLHVEAHLVLVPQQALLFHAQLATQVLSFKCCPYDYR